MVCPLIPWLRDNFQSAVIGDMGTVSIITKDRRVFNIISRVNRHKQDIHSHPRCFVSRVRYGTLIQDLFDAQDRVLCTMVLPTGSMYYLDQDQRHRVRADFAITEVIVVKRRKIREYKLLYGYANNGTWEDVMKVFRNTKEFKCVRSSTTAKMVSHSPK